MTQKTGNYKKYTIFVEMLLSALRKTNKTVSIDFLTVDDLKLAAPKAALPLNQKRIYLVVTYAVAFDRFLMLM